ncbi:MAG: hypothetical protein ACR2PS_06605 [Pseudomonadales bacterium]
MTSAGLRRAAAVILIAAYPLLVYFGLQIFTPRLLVIVLLLMAGLRWLAWDGDRKVFLMYWLAAIFLVVVATLVTGSNIGLLFYPLLVNLILLTFFAISLYKPPTVIETIARKQHGGELPDLAIEYARKVTIVWCVFFMLNGAVSVWSVFHSHEVWLLYNGLIAYLLIALLMGAEYLVRRRVVNQINA